MTSPRSWRAAGDVPVIIDGGGNVGYASVYFANRFPEALVLSIEPDPDNFAVLQQNTSQHDNIRPVHGALWQDESGVELRRETSGGWSTSTVPSRNNGGIPSWRIEELLRQVSRSRVLILKVDIEGSERQVCEASPQTVRSAPCLIVEPHDYDRLGGWVPHATLSGHLRKGSRHSRSGRRPSFPLFEFVLAHR